MIAWALNFAFAAFALAWLICGWRVLFGPQALDRVLAFDTLYLCSVALIVLAGMHSGQGLLFEAALLVALLGFVSTAALARYLTRGAAIE